MKEKGQEGAKKSVLDQPATKRTWEERNEARRRTKEEVNPGAVASSPFFRGRKGAFRFV